MASPMMSENDKANGDTGQAEESTSAAFKADSRALCEEAKIVLESSTPTLQVNAERLGTIIQGWYRRNADLKKSNSELSRELGLLRSTLEVRLKGDVLFRRLLVETQEKCAGLVQEKNALKMERALLYDDIEILKKGNDSKDERVAKAIDCVKVLQNAYEKTTDRAKKWAARLDVVEDVARQLGVENRSLKRSANAIKKVVQDECDAEEEAGAEWLVARTKVLRKRIDQLVNENGQLKGELVDFKALYCSS